MTTSASPRPTPEQVQVARDRYALEQARAWGYDPDHPGTLATAIERLRRAARPDPTDVYRDRTDPHDQRHRRDCVMLRYRAATFFGRLYAPDLLLGMQTVEEARDIEVDPVTGEVTSVRGTAKVKERMRAMGGGNDGTP